MFANMNPNMKENIKSLIRRRKIGPLAKTEMISLKNLRAKVVMDFK
jgi:hypothetical protein